MVCWIFNEVSKACPASIIKINECAKQNATKKKVTSKTYEENCLLACSAM
jgi:hypothetical protein